MKREISQWNQPQKIKSELSRLITKVINTSCSRRVEPSGHQAFCITQIAKNASLPNNRKFRMSRITHLSLASLRGLSVSTIINQLILKALLKESYEKEKLTSIFILLMQSYGEFRLIPRNILKSSPTCVDNGTNFGQIEEIGPKDVQKVSK